LVRDSVSNPHKDVSFHTSWDVILGRESPGTADKGAFKDVLNAKSEGKESNELTKDRGIEM
jgi:hypothetical protein